MNFVIEADNKRDTFFKCSIIGGTKATSIKLVITDSKLASKTTYILLEVFVPILIV